jgi:hypothetical protein
VGRVSAVDREFARRRACGRRLSTGASSEGCRGSVTETPLMPEPHSATPNSLTALRTFGFEQAGRVVGLGEGISIVLERADLRDASPVLYAFAADEVVLYVGKSARSLGARMQGYQTPRPTQSTNIRVHQFLREALRQGGLATVWAWRDPKTHMLGGLLVDLAAGLESAVIELVKPRWNGGAVRGSSARTPVTPATELAAGGRGDHGDHRDHGERTDSHADRILDHLDAASRRAPGSGLCDDCLALSLGISPRQTVNIVARRLESAGEFHRESMTCARCGGNKVCNRGSSSRA